MAAKRKGGLKLNAICAKLSRQVVFDHGGAEQARADKGAQRESSKKEAPQPGTKEVGSEFSDGLSRVQKIEEDKRREVIEKWVNGEYNDELLLGRVEGKEGKGTESVEMPPEGVYMVQPKGCSDEEDNGDEADALQGSQDGSFLDDRDSDGPASKDESYRSSSGETGSKLAGGAASGKAWSLHSPIRLYPTPWTPLCNFHLFRRSQSPSCPCASGTSRLTHEFTPSQLCTLSSMWQPGPDECTSAPARPHAVLHNGD